MGPTVCLWRRPIRIRPSHIFIPNPPPPNNHPFSQPHPWHILAPPLSPLPTLRNESRQAPRQARAPGRPTDRPTVTVRRARPNNAHVLPVAATLRPTEGTPYLRRPRTMYVHSMRCPASHSPDVLAYQLHFHILLLTFHCCRRRSWQMLLRYCVYI